MSDDHLARLERVYSSATWDVYELLDRSLDPRGPDWLQTKAGEYLHPGAVMLDAGCRDARQLMRLVQAHDITGVGVEPVAIHVERARAAVDAAGLRNRIDIVAGTIENLAGDFDFIWCRDVLEQVAALDRVLAALARLLRLSGRLLVYTTVATDLLEPGEAAMLSRHLGNVPANLIERNLETAFADAGFRIEEKTVIGTEWQEYAEERTHPASTALLRLARLRRLRGSVGTRHGEDIYLHVEANLHWQVFQLLGKLRPLVYVLQRRDGAD